MDTQLVNERDLAKRLHRVPSAAKQLGLTAKGLWNFVYDGRIGFVRIGSRSVRIPQAEIDRLIEEGWQPARRTA